MGSRWETSLSDGVVALNKEVEENSYYVSILQTILSLLSNPIFANQIIEENFNENQPGICKGFKNGKSFKEHHLFSDGSKINIRF